MEINKIVDAQHKYYFSKKTLSISFRKDALKKLKQNIIAYQNELSDALYKDLGKSAVESYMCEIGLTLSHISYTLRKIDSWCRTRRVRTPLSNFPAKSMILQEPYGVTLIMSPWNYPVLLTLEPLIGAIAAGNCAVIKLSEYSPNTSSVIKKIIESTFPFEYVAVITGDREENKTLLDQKFDYIFYTGGVNVGKLVMEKASQNLTPITLELGGKSPVIIDHTANLRLAAKRITFGKYLNCGQTCIAPDYILIEESVHDKFVDYLKEETYKMFGNGFSNPDYGRIINKQHFDRLSGLIDAQKVIYGGKTKQETLQIEPTIMDNVTADDAVMQEEIFGPIMPIIVVKNLDEAYIFVSERERPLALYLFTSDKKTEQRFTREISFGGGCINDTIQHIASENLPFGGVGNSGMGQYHGKYTFKTFSREKTIVKKHTWLDITMRYQPYTAFKERLIKKFLK